MEPVSPDAVLLVPQGDQASPVPSHAEVVVVTDESSSKSLALLGDRAVRSPRAKRRAFRLSIVVKTGIPTFEDKVLQRAAMLLRSDAAGRRLRARLLRGFAHVVTLLGHSLAKRPGVRNRNPMK
jgi:hypothetical protein